MSAPGDRAAVFGEEDLDLSGFAPKPVPAPSQSGHTTGAEAGAGPMAGPMGGPVRGVAERAGFHSREPAAAAAGPVRREQRRYRTGRNVQLNLKVRQDAVDAFYKLADAQGWVLGEAFERAVAALAKDIG